MDPEGLGPTIPGQSRRRPPRSLPVLGAAPAVRSHPGQPRAGAGVAAALPQALPQAPPGSAAAGPCAAAGCCLCTKGTAQQRVASAPAPLTSPAAGRAGLRRHHVPQLGGRDADALQPLRHLGCAGEGGRRRRRPRRDKLPPRPRAGAAPMAALPLGLGEVRDAERRLRGLIHRTPLLTCAGLDRMAGRRLLFKCELLQKTGSFKVRGDGGAAKARGKGRFLQEGNSRCDTQQLPHGRCPGLREGVAGARRTSSPAHTALPADARCPERGEEPRG